MARYTGPKAGSEDNIVRHSIGLRDGRVVQLFVNRDTNLVVLDVIDADEQGGTEVYRRTLSPGGHARRRRASSRPAFTGRPR
jgi:hypothetical protein